MDLASTQSRRRTSFLVWATLLRMVTLTCPVVMVGMKVELGSGAADSEVVESAAVEVVDLP